MAPAPGLDPLFTSLAGVGTAVQVNRHVVLALVLVLMRMRAPE